MNANVPNPVPAPADQIRVIRNKVRGLLKHEERKLLKQRAEVEEAGMFGKYAEIADSLMADLAAAPRGTAKTVIKNIYTETGVEVTLNPALDATRNAELYYRRARKGRRGYETATAMAAETAERIDKLKTVILDIDAVVAAADPLDAAVDSVREIAAEFLPEESVNAKGRPKNVPPPPPFKKYTIDGWEVYMGKTSRQNDELSIHFAKPSDLWLHVVGYAGSHVIIRRAKNVPYPPPNVIQKAAQIAVWFSKAKHTSFAEVHVTEARFVRKRRKAPPGEVIAERCKTVRVEPKNPEL
ncbi:MAG: NFACT RNA binding domain-containing protein [Chitinispirillales bacterium]|jgi:predicted ribosome quality control (RQC) complex YloA/Tae2 family protein|nr:NFACT RNA binding domain-containing protein [Chitinispirillales bacterium]